MEVTVSRDVTPADASAGPLSYALLYCHQALVEVHEYWFHTCLTLFWLTNQSYPGLSHHTVQESKKSHHEPLQELANSVGSEVSASTVCRVFADQGLHQRRAQRVVLPTNIQ